MGRSAGGGSGAPGRPFRGGVEKRGGEEALGELRSSQRRRGFFAFSVWAVLHSDVVLEYSADRHDDRHSRHGEGNGARGASRRDGKGVRPEVSSGASVRASAAGTWVIEHWEAEPSPWDGRTVA